MQKNTDPQTLKQWLNKNTATLVDVRRTDEYAREHIPGAVSLPLDILSEEALEQIPTEKIVLQCNTGGRSERSCVAAVGLETNHEIYNLDGGITAWKEAGFSVKQTESAILLPVYRQVQIAVGTLIITGVVLGFFVSQWFYLLSLLVGLGLLNAGVTGWCGMGKLLALAPWNRVSE